MTRAIQQSVVLPASAARLYEMYVTAEEHAGFTGAAVEVEETPGSKFSAFDGVLTGRMLAFARPRLIVQSWRSTKFNADDQDSTLILTFSDEADGGRIDLVHLNVPEHDYDGVTEGWPQHYWTPWRKYLTRIK